MQSASTTKPRARGKNWSTEECRLLAQSWVAVSEDPAKGKDQTRDDFWSRIAERLDGRSSDSSTKQFLRMAQAVQKFSSCVYQISEKNQSGTTFEDTITSAKALYAADCSATFKYFDSWMILKKCPKFQEYSASVPSLAQFASPKTATSDEAASDLVRDGSKERPLGCKAAKEASKKRLFQDPDVQERKKTHCRRLREAKSIA